MTQAGLIRTKALAAQLLQIYEPNSEQCETLEI